MKYEEGLKNLAANLENKWPSVPACEAKEDF